MENYEIDPPYYVSDRLPADGVYKNADGTFVLGRLVSIGDTRRSGQFFQVLPFTPFVAAPDDWQTRIVRKMP